MQQNGDFDNMESFMAGMKLNNPSDMEVGPDGRLYIVEYGSGWFAQNADAGLVRIDYNNGNRAPKVTGVQVSKTSGTLPLNIEATVGARDPDNDRLTYVWHIGGKTVETKEPKLQTTLSTAGDYAIYTEVKDGKDGVSKSNIVSVYAGNQAPSVDIRFKGNQTFYFPGQPVDYTVSVLDKEDGNVVIDSNLMITADYREGNDKAGASQGHQVLSEAMMGKNLMESLDCKACHKLAEKSVGPAFAAVSEKYKKDAGATVYLANKIIKGGGGVWGEAVMAAHPNLSEGDSKQIVTWILSMANDKHQKSMPANGNVSPTLNKPAIANGVFYLTASYTDKGGQNIKSLTGNTVSALRSNMVTFGGVTRMKDAQTITYNNSLIMFISSADGWFALDSIDLSGITKATMSLGWQDILTGSNVFELHLDGPDGKLLGKYDVQGNKPDDKSPLTTRMANLALSSVTDGKLHNVYVVKKSSGDSKNQAIGVTNLTFLLK